MTNVRAFLACGLALCALPSPAFTQAIAYRGKLVADHANRISAYTPIPMVFRLYGQSEGGKVLWARKHSVAMNADGSFALMIGDDCGVAVRGAAYERIADALGAAKDGAWIGLTPGNAKDDDTSLEFVPRQRLSPVPQAYRAAVARQSDRLAATRISCTRLDVGESLVADTMSVPDGRTVSSLQDKRLLLGEGELRVEGATLVFTSFDPPMTVMSKDPVATTDYPRLAIVKPFDSESDVPSFGTRILLPGETIEESAAVHEMTQVLGSKGGGK